MESDKKTFPTRLILRVLKRAFIMLNPMVQFKNPVMFIVYIAAIFCTAYAWIEWFDDKPSYIHRQIIICLWLTVFFANLSRAIAENLGERHAARLKNTKSSAYARMIKNGLEVKIPAEDLKLGDVIICEVGDIIPVDGIVIEGVATVDESAITGESAPVIREEGSERNTVTAGTRMISDRLTIRVTSESERSFLDQMIHILEGIGSQRSPNEVALNLVLSFLIIHFLFTCLSLKPYTDYSLMQEGQPTPHLLTFPVFAALLVSLIPTTIGSLLGVISISGIFRLIKNNIIAKSAKIVEMAGDIDLLMLDKTGTITMGDRVAVAFLPVAGVNEKEFATIAQLASLSDETPEGRSIVVLAKKAFDLRAQSLDTANSTFIPFSSKTRMSGIDFLDKEKNVERSIRKGAPDVIKSQIISLGGSYPQRLDLEIDLIAKQGDTPLLVSDGKDIVGLVHLKDMIKGGLKERFADLRNMGIRTVMITGDNPITAAFIAAEAGVDDYIAEADPQDKLARIKTEQQKGRLVAMIGDGTNDAPALAQANIGVAMNTGTLASREAGNMVDLDNNPAKLIKVVEIGKQLLMTRGALTLFSLTSNVAKYFAILPAILGELYIGAGIESAPLKKLNIMALHSPESAILSTAIFNAVIILALLPLALKGVPYRPKPTKYLLRQNLIIYGLGGLAVPFAGIKLIDTIIYFINRM